MRRIVQRIATLRRGGTVRRIKPVQRIQALRRSGTMQRIPTLRRSGTVRRIKPVQRIQALRRSGTMQRIPTLRRSGTVRRIKPVQRIQALRRSGTVRRVETVQRGGAVWGSKLPGSCTSIGEPKASGDAYIWSGSSSKIRLGRLIATSPDASARPAASRTSAADRPAGQGSGSPQTGHSIMPSLGPAPPACAASISRAVCARTLSGSTKASVGATSLAPITRARVRGSESSSPF
ncbi:hypothetical protein [Paractinoplanes durhamensis]|uniref:hypothetical protein n=1 Tax=Paractinoplanes durhamensis TaxID=113563 RepID=UPI0036371856